MPGGTRRDRIGEMAQEPLKNETGGHMHPGENSGGAECVLVVNGAN